jgi:hypothetical protein
LAALAIAKILSENIVLISVVRRRMTQVTLITHLHGPVRRKIEGLEKGVGV